jgi:hypothetical protein
MSRVMRMMGSRVWPTCPSTAFVLLCVSGLLGEQGYGDDGLEGVADML